MNYKKLISNRLSGLSRNIPHTSGDKTGAVIGLLAGLAVGAVLGVLFAPDSGKRTRERISDKALDLADSAKDGLHTIKDKINNGKDSLIGLKDRVIDGVKSKVDQTSQEFKAFRDAELDKAKAVYNEIADDSDETTEQRI